METANDVYIVVIYCNFHVALKCFVISVADILNDL